MAQQKLGVMLYFELRPSLRRLSSRERLALYDAIMNYGEWRVSKDSEAERPTSGDNGSYPSTNPNSNPDPNPTSCCYDNAAGKPPRQPQRLIPPTVFPSTPPRNRFAHPL